MNLLQSVPANGFEGWSIAKISYHTNSNGKACHRCVYVKCILSVLLFENLLSHTSLQWRHNGSDSVSNHQPRECLLSRLIRCISKKTSKLRVTGLCAGNSPLTGEFPAQRPVTRKMFPFDDVIMWQWYGFLPVWVRRWSFKLLWYLNNFLHT